VVVELRDTIEMDPPADDGQVGERPLPQIGDFKFNPPDLGSFRDQIVEGGNVPG
jgi:hypothetical protein